MHRLRKLTYVAIFLLLLSAISFSLFVNSGYLRIKQPSVSDYALQKATLLENQWNKILDNTNNQVVSFLSLKKHQDVIPAFLSYTQKKQINQTLTLLAKELPYVETLQLTDENPSVLNKVVPTGGDFEFKVRLPLTKELFYNYPVIATFNLDFMRNIIEPKHGVQLTSYCGHTVLNYNPQLFDTTYSAVKNKEGKLQVYKPNTPKEILEKVTINNKTWYLRYALAG